MNKKICVCILVCMMSLLIACGSENGSTNHWTSDANDLSRSENAGLPEFSAESGFYDEEFKLTISCESGEIYYTLDGTDPAANKSAMHYEKPIKIYDNTQDLNRVSSEKNITLSAYNPPRYKVDKGIVLRVAVKGEDGNFGKTVTKTYFVGKDKEYYRNMKVISLVTNPYNLFDPDYGIYAIGNSYFEWKKSPDFDPAMEDWRLENPTNYNQGGPEWERPASIQVFENGKLVYEQDLGIRLAGNVSRHFAQKSIRLYAREEYGDKKLKYAFFPDLKDINGNPIEKFDKVTLRNDGNDSESAFFRDELVQSLCADRAVGTQAEEPCILFIDGEYWGMYHIKERIENSYFASHYDVDKKNVTYVKKSEVEGSEEIRQEYEDFYNWAMTADLSVEENYQKVADTVDMQSFMDYFAIETYINNYDWLRVGEHPNNILMWRVNEPVEGNPYGDGKWRYVLYDMEYSSNLYGQDGTRPEFNSLKNISMETDWYNPGPLFSRLLKNTEFRKAFYENYLEIMENNFNPKRVNEWIDQYTEDYYLAIMDNFNRFLSMGNNTGFLDYHINTVKEFYELRPDCAKRYLDRLCSE